MISFNSTDYLTFWRLDCRILPIIGLQRPPEVGAALVPIITQVGTALVPRIPLGSGVELPHFLVSLTPLGAGVEVPLTPLGTGVVPSRPVMIIFHRVLFVHVLFEATTMKISCTADDLSVCGASTILVFMVKAG